MDIKLKIPFLLSFCWMQCRLIISTHNPNRFWVWFKAYCQWKNCFSSVTSIVHSLINNRYYGSYKIHEIKNSLLASSGKIQGRHWILCDHQRIGSSALKVRTCLQIYILDIIADILIGYFVYHLITVTVFCV